MIGNSNNKNKLLKILQGGGFFRCSFITLGKERKMGNSVSEKTRCAEQKCLGEIDLTTEVQIGGDSIGYPCSACGRLHTESGRDMGGLFFKDGLVSHRKGV